MSLLILCRAIEDLDDIIFQCEQVGVWIKAGPWYVYKKMRENGIYVSLDGHGGDELLGGYPQHTEWAMRDAFRPWPNVIRYFELRKILRSLYRDGMNNGSAINMPSLSFLFGRMGNINHPKRETIAEKKNCLWVP